MQIHDTTIAHWVRIEYAAGTGNLLGYNSGGGTTGTHTLAAAPEPATTSLLIRLDRSGHPPARVADADREFKPRFRINVR